MTPINIGIAISPQFQDRDRDVMVQNNLELETGSNFLLETGSYLLLET